MFIRKLFLLSAVMVFTSSACDSSGGDDDDQPADMDGDGYASPEDCNDQSSAINPGAPETCDGIDQNCNGQFDEGFTTATYYGDSDGDGYGSPGNTTVACVKPAGYVENALDCNDGDRLISPSTPEVACNGIDENCSSVDDDSPDADFDGFDTCDVGAPGSDANPKDCNDGSSAVYPGAPEICNNLDENCNTVIDEDLPLLTFYQDADTDRYGTPEVTAEACGIPAGFADNDDDCDDTDLRVFPGAPETFSDGKDSNCNGYQDVILTAAGTGVEGFGGDNGPVLNAVLDHPTGISRDAQGNYVFTDSENHRIRMFQIDGTITTLAGTGVEGYGGDGSYAISAQFNLPTSLSVDAGGNIYVADTLNHRIRVILANGKIQTFAGNGVAGYSGDGGSALAAQLNHPMGVVADLATNVYVADTENHRIRRIQIINPTTQTTRITTVVGTGVEGFGGDEGPGDLALVSSPQGVGVDPTGSVSIADTGNHVIRLYNPIAGKITTVAGTPGEAGYDGDYGDSRYALLNSPTQSFVGHETEVYIVDSGNHVIRLVEANGTISTVAGNGEAGYSGDGGRSTLASFNNPTSVAVDMDSYNALMIADTGNHRIRRLLW